MVEGDEVNHQVALVTLNNQPFRVKSGRDDDHYFFRSPKRFCIEASCLMHCPDQRPGGGCFDRDHPNQYLMSNSIGTSFLVQAGWLRLKSTTFGLAFTARRLQFSRLFCHPAHEQLIGALVQLDET